MTRASHIRGDRCGDPSIGLRHAMKTVLGFRYSIDLLNLQNYLPNIR